MKKLLQVLGVLGSFVLLGALVAAAPARDVTPVSHTGMCVATSGCVKITATTAGDGGVASLTPGQWYQFKVSSSGGDGCLKQGSAVVACTNNGTLPLEAGERLRDAYAATEASVDGGPLDKTTLYFAATPRPCP